MSRLTILFSLVMTIVLHSAGLGSDKESAPEETVPKVDLAKFPKIEGKVVQVVGSLNSYLPPRVGAEVHWDLNTITQQKNLTFSPLPGDRVDQYYIPLAIDFTINRDGTNPVIPFEVESVDTYTTGDFRSMRLVSRSQRKGSKCVKVDISYSQVPGDRGSVRISVLLESEVFDGLVLIEGKPDGPFPKPTPAAK